MENVLHILPAQSALHGLVPVPFLNELKTVFTDWAILHIHADELLLAEGVRPPYVYVIHEGTCTVGAGMDSPHHQIWFYASQGDWLGLEAFCSAAPLPYYVKTNVSCKIERIPAAFIEKAITERPELSVSLMRVLNKKIDDIQNRGLGLMSRDKEQLFLKTLQQWRDLYGTDANGYINITATVNDLAAYVGMSRSSAYRILSQLEEKLLVRFNHNRFRLLH